LRQPSGLTAPLPHAPYAAAAANGAVLHYWRPFHWYSAFARVAAAATDRATNLTSLRWTFGGFHGAEGTDAGEDYFIDHVAEELDAPREFYFDAASQTLFYFHNATAGTPPPAGWVFEAPLLHALINVTGSAAAPVANVTLLGLTLTGAAASFFKPHGLPAGGDWTAARIGALTVAAIPCEVFVEIGLALKATKPLAEHFTISLANGYNGYLPTPEHHALGGYETWRARSSYLEVDASKKITATLRDLLASVAK
jgi:hypothetical protein